MMSIYQSGVIGMMRCVNTMDNIRYLSLAFIIIITGIMVYIEHKYPKVASWFIYPMAALYIIVVTLLLTGEL